jgi:hypothetical protein
MTISCKIGNNQKHWETLLPHVISGYLCAAPKYQETRGEVRERERERETIPTCWSSS